MRARPPSSRGQRSWSLVRSASLVGLKSCQQGCSWHEADAPPTLHTPVRKLRRYRPTGGRQRGAPVRTKWIILARGGSAGNCDLKHRRNRLARRPVMRVLVNGVRLFFDVEGARLVPDGPTMREKPTLLLLHGGPGFDHSIYKPAYSGLADCAQVIYLDHRGNGRSDAGPKEAWTLAQWGDDVRAFCDLLGIERPIVLGASFGGKVGHGLCDPSPDPPAKLILISTGQDY